jgi:hypothetical protein
MVKTRAQTAFEAEPKPPPGVLLPGVPRVDRLNKSKLPRKYFQVGVGHPLHNRSMPGGTSKFEFAGQEIVQWWVYAMTLVNLAVTFAFKIPHFLPGHNDLTVDCVVCNPNGSPVFAVEFDGPHHYKYNHFYRHSGTPKPWSYQMKRDRYVEDTLLHAGMSVFRIPYTLHEKNSTRLLVKAGAYIAKALERDSVDGKHIHYLDYWHSYVNINGTHNVQPITAVQNPHDPTVFIRGVAVVE